MKRPFKKLRTLLPLLCTLSWGTAPLMIGSTLLASCDIINLGGGEDDGEDPDGEGGGIDEPSLPGDGDTSDGKTPYIRFETDTLRLPAYQKEALNLTYKTNIYDGYYVLESMKNYQDSGEYAQQIPDFMLKYPEGNIYSTQEPLYLEFYNNHTAKPKFDHILVYQRRYENDTLIAKLPVVQEVGASITPKVAKTDLNNVTLELTPHNGATQYAIYVSEDSIPLSSIIQDVNEGMDKLFTSTLTLPGNRMHTVENLQDATGYYAYIMAYDQENNAGAISVIPFATGIRNSEDDLVLEISLNPLNEYTAYLPLSGNVKGVIDWGDGNSESVDTYIGTSGSLKHQYSNISSVTKKQIRFRGTADGLTSISTSYQDYICNSLTGIVQWGRPNLKTISFQEVKTLKTLPKDTRGALAGVENLDECFYNCTALETLPEGLFTYATKVRSFNRTFYGCTSLRSVPADLFATAKEATSFYYTFFECSALTSVPEDLFAQNTQANNMNDVFAYCTSLQSIPAGLFRNNANLISLKSAFSYCTSLKTVPQGLFAACSKVTSLGELHYPGNNSASGIFSDCTALESIPGDLFSAMTELKSIPGIFDGCTSLKAIPENLFANNKKLRNMEFAFAGCKSLTSLPASLFDQNRMLESIYDAFSGCSSLSGESPYSVIDGKKVHLYERGNYPDYFLNIASYSDTFKGCTNLSDYGQMPDRWK